MLTSSPVACTSHNRIHNGVVNINHTEFSRFISEVQRMPNQTKSLGGYGSSAPKCYVFPLDRSAHFPWVETSLVVYPCTSTIPAYPFGVNLALLLKPDMAFYYEPYSAQSTRSAISLFYATVCDAFPYKAQVVTTNSSSISYNAALIPSTIQTDSDILPDLVKAGESAIKISRALSSPKCLRNESNPLHALLSLYYFERAYFQTVNAQHAGSPRNVSFPFSLVGLPMQLVDLSIQKDNCRYALRKLLEAVQITEADLQIIRSSPEIKDAMELVASKSK